MGQVNQDFSTQKISPKLISQIIDTVKNKAYGSVEIYIENYTVTQITERTITKVCKTPRTQIQSPTNGEYKSGTKFVHNMQD